MEKLKYKSQYKKIDKKILEEFKTKMFENIKIKEINIFWNFMFTIGWILLIIIGLGIISLPFLLDYWSSRNIYFILGGIILFLGILCIGYYLNYKKKLENFIKNSMPDFQKKVYKSYFDKNYDNVISLGNISENMIENAKKFRPKNIPSNAKITKVFGGQKIQLNNSLLNMAKFEWTWYVNDTKFTGDSLNIIADNFPERMKLMSVELYKNHMFNKNVNTLENQNFNKIWNYSSNDKIKLRLLFTLFTQEQLIEKNNLFFEKRSSLIFRKEENGPLFISFKTDPKNTMFELNFKKLNIRGKRKVVKENIFNSILIDLEEDFSSIVYVLTNLSLFKTLF